jgi:hypothetical protein
MTCKECVHYELCFDYTHLKHSKNLPDNREDVCEHFKNKANFVELPCKVLDKVYVPIEGTSSIFETKVLSIGVDEDGDFVLNPYEYPDDVFCVNGVNIGKTVFLTKEDAEKVLKGGADNG